MTTELKPVVQYEETFGKLVIGSPLILLVQYCYTCHSPIG